MNNFLGYKHLKNKTDNGFWNFEFFLKLFKKHEKEFTTLSETPDYLETHSEIITDLPNVAEIIYHLKDIPFGTLDNMVHHINYKNNCNLK